MWFGRDEFHFAWKKVRGDFILQARVEFLGQGRGPPPEGGADGPLDPRSRLPSRQRVPAWRRSDVAAVPPGAGRGHRGGPFRSERSRRAAARAEGQHLHDVRRPLRRSLRDAGRLRASRSATRCTSASTSARTTRRCPEKAIVSNVRLIRPAADTFTPYRDYIGSQVEAARCRDRCATSRPPGRRLHAGTELDARREAAHREPQRPHLWLRPRDPPMADIDTGPMTRNNNDHALSFDGKMLGLSGGQPSTVWTVPAAGGTPHADHARRALPTSTAGRRTASSSSSPGSAMATSTSTSFRLAAAPRSG